MFRTLLATTALAALMTAPTLAQEAQPADPNANAGANVTVETTGEPEVIIETPEGEQQPAATTTPPAEGETPAQPAEGQTVTVQPEQPAETGTAEVPVETAPADPEMQAQPAQPTDMSQGYQPQPTDQLASELIGMTVYSTLQDPAAAAQPAEGAAAPATDPATGQPLDDAAAAGGAAVDATGQAAQDAGAAVEGAVDPTAGREAIGDITDLVLNETGQVGAVIIGVGGFLGIGEKNVAVAFDQLQWVAGADGNQVLMMNTTREALEAAPEFDTETIGQAVNTDAAAVQSGGAATETTTVTTEPAEGGAMAPTEEAPAAQ